MIVYYLLYGFAGLALLSWVARIVLVGLTALYVHRLATKGPQSVTVLGWAILLLSYLTFRQESRAPSVTSLAAGAAAAVAGGVVGSIAADQRRQSLLERGYPNNQAPGTLSGRINNGNRLR